MGVSEAVGVSLDSGCPWQSLKLCSTSFVGVFLPNKTMGGAQVVVRVFGRVCGCGHVPCIPGFDDTSLLGVAS